MPSYIPNPDAVKETRKMKILRTDIIEHGATDGCPGCRATMAGERGRNHTDTCRKRIEDMIAASDIGKERMERAMARMTKAIVEEGERLMKSAVDSRPAPAEAPPAPEPQVTEAEPENMETSAEPSTPKPTSKNRTAAVKTPVVDDRTPGTKRQASSPAFNANAGVLAKV